MPSRHALNSQPPDWVLTANRARSTRRLKDNPIANACSSDNIQVIAPTRGCSEEIVKTYRLFIQLDMLARNVWGSSAVRRWSREDAGWCIGKIRGAGTPVSRGLSVFRRRERVGGVRGECLSLLQEYRLVCVSFLRGCGWSAGMWNWQ